MNAAIAARRIWALSIAAVLAGSAAARADGAPALESPSVVVIDAATGGELHAAHADEVRPIASMTKIFVAMALRRHHLALDQAWLEARPVQSYHVTGAGHPGTESIRNRLFHGLGPFNASC